MITARQEFLLITLLNTAKAVEMSFLCEKLSIGERTLKEDIREINQFLKAYDLEVKQTDSGKYYIAEDKKEELTKVLKDYESLCQWIPETPGQRQFIIMLLLLWEDGPLTMDELSERLLVSKSCIFHDIKQLNVFVKQVTGVELEISKAIGVQFNAIEVVKRKLISALIHKHYMTDANYLMRVFLHFELGTREQYRSLVLLYQKNFNQQGIVLADYGFITFILENLAFAGRIRSGNEIEDFYIEGYREDILPFSEAEEILNVHFSQNEKYWLSYIYRQKRVVLMGQQQLIEDEAGTKDEVTAQFVERIKEKYGMDMKKATDKLLDLERHIKAMLSRIKLNHHEDAYMAKKIMKRAQLEYEMAGEIIPIIEELTGITITDIERAYIALHLTAIIEEIQEPLHVLLVSNSAAIMVQTLKSKLEKTFKGQLIIEGYYSTHQIDYALEQMKDIDLILTTHTIKQKVDIPMLSLHEMFTQEDWENISAYLKKM